MWARLGIAAVVLAALVAGWFVLRRPEVTPAPVIAVVEGKVAPVLLPPPDASLPVWPPPLNTDIAVVEPPAPDSGATMEVVLEVFDEKGHLAAQEVVLQNPPCPTDGPKGYGVTLRARTNMMGLARIALPAGTWEVENFHSVPPRIEVGFGTNTFVLKRTDPAPKLIEGTVIDELGQPVPLAQVFVAPPTAFLSYRHATPRGDSAADADTSGRFVVRTYDAQAILQARKEPLLSRDIAAPAGSKNVVLKLFAPAWVRVDLPCPSGFVQYEHAGETYERPIGRNGELMVAAGTRRLRMRCESRGDILAAATDVELPAGSRTNVSFEAKRLEMAKVKVVDANGRPMNGVTVIAGKDNAVVTDSRGEATVKPPKLDSFDPVFKLDLQGAWKPRAETRARLGDATIEIVAVPR